LDVDESEVQWDFSWLRWHCLNEIEWFLFHQFTFGVFDMYKSEIIWDISGVLNGLWVLILLEIIIDVELITGVNELEVQWDLSKGLEGLTSNIFWLTSLDQG